MRKFIAFLFLLINSGNGSEKKNFDPFIIPELLLPMVSISIQT